MFHNLALLFSLNAKSNLHGTIIGLQEKQRETPKSQNRKLKTINSINLQMLWKMIKPTRGNMIKPYEKIKSRPIRQNYGHLLVPEVIIYPITPLIVKLEPTNCGKIWDVLSLFSILSVTIIIPNDCKLDEPTAVKYETCFFYQVYCHHNIMGADWTWDMFFFFFFFVTIISHLATFIRGWFNYLTEQTSATDRVCIAVRSKVYRFSLYFKL